MQRIALNIILLVSVLFLPWVVTVFAGVLAVFAQKNFYEIIAWAIFYDLLYGASQEGILGFTFFFTLGALVLLYGSQFLKSKTRFA